MFSRYIIGFICASLFISFNAKAFDLGKILKKSYDDAKNSQQAEHNDTQSIKNTQAPSNANVKANPTTERFNILGLYLNMDMNDALSILKNRKPSVRIAEVAGNVRTIAGSRLAGQYVAGLRGERIQHTSTGGDEVIQVLRAAPPNRAVVTGIGRYDHLGKMISHSYLRDLLIKKYGKPVVEYQPDYGGKNAYYTMSWNLKPNGKPETRKKVIEICSLNGNSPRGFGILWKVNGVSSSREDIYKECGFVFVVKMFTGAIGPKKLYKINNYTTVLYDLKKIIDSNNRTVDYSIVEAKKLKMIEEERLRKTSKSVHPDL
jgi:hypothetical protein